MSCLCSMRPWKGFYEITHVSCLNLQTAYQIIESMAFERLFTVDSLVESSQCKKEGSMRRTSVKQVERFPIQQKILKYEGLWADLRISCVPKNCSFTFSFERKSSSTRNKWLLAVFHLRPIWVRAAWRIYRSGLWKTRLPQTPDPPS